MAKKAQKELITGSDACGVAEGAEGGAGRTARRYDEGWLRRSREKLVVVVGMWVEGRRWRKVG